MIPALLIVLAYLLGSVPFGQIIAKAHGKDLREVGSGNIGATNLSRVLGKKWGYTCFLLDVFKGFVPVTVGSMMMSSPPQHSDILLLIAVGVAAVMGHVFPVYLKFKGGKGVATSFGVALGIWPYFTISAAVALLVWIAFVLIWKYVSLASIVAAMAFPVSLVTMIAFRQDWELANLWPLLIASLAIPILVIWRHTENIKRLMAGTESKVLQKR